MDRIALVHRHHPTLRALDPLSPFSVGNGEFAFTADITGLQTFPDAYASGITLHTQSQWGWHSFPNPQGFRVEDTFEPYLVNGREVPYACKGAHPSSATEAADYLRANPHRLDLGRVGLVLHHADGSAVTPESLENIEQTLDLWRGRLDSRFTLDGAEVRVTTLCHPELDVLAVRIQSAALEQARVGVRIAFPYGCGEWKHCADWEQPDAHRTVIVLGEHCCDFSRFLDEDRYFARLDWVGKAKFERGGPHEF